MKPPTIFTREPRSVKLSQKRLALGRYTRTDSSECRCLYTGQWVHYIKYGEKWKVEVIAVAVLSLTMEMLVPVVYALEIVQ